MFHDFIFVIRLVIRTRRIMACVEPHHIVFIHVHVTDICFFILVIYQIIAGIALITHIYTPFIPVKIAYQHSFFKGDRGTVLLSCNPPDTCLSSVGFATYII